MWNRKSLSKKWVILMMSILLSLPSGCSNTSDNKDLKAQLFGDNSTEYENIEYPENFDWRQCEGTILNFICEDNINANILSKESEEFTEATGIIVNIKRMDFNTLEEKINLEFISKTAQYELIYVDPYKTLNRFANGLEDLYKYEKDPTLPHIVGGIDSFAEKELEVCSYFKNENKLYSIPFDSTTMILFYRKDIFEKYENQMRRDLGFDPNPNNKNFTWDHYIEVVKWIRDNVDSSEVKYPSITMSARHNSIYTVFSSVLSAYGGDYFKNDKIVSLGTSTGPEIQTNTTEFQLALKVFKEIINLNPKNKQGYTWDETANIFIAGDAAMMINWDENVSGVENSHVADKTGYAVLPRGSHRSSNIYGGSGIGINSYADSNKKLAAWMFIVWATSPRIQMKTFTEKDGGTLPPRSALKEQIVEQYSISKPQVEVMLLAQSSEYAYYRPKMKNGYEFENILINNLFDMVQENLKVKNVAINIRSQWNEHN